MQSSAAEPVALSGSPRPTPWDPGLGDAMTAVGRVVYEESVAGPLIADLAARGPRPRPAQHGARNSNSNKAPTTRLADRPEQQHGAHGKR